MMVPSWMWGEFDIRYQDRNREAERQVKEKFPNLIEGSSGWCRAVANRTNRIPLDFKS